MRDRKPDADVRLLGDSPNGFGGDLCAAPNLVSISGTSPQLRHANISHPLRNALKKRSAESVAAHSFKRRARVAPS